MDSAQVDFNITVLINEEEKHIKVVQLETSDGGPYYSCLNGDVELTQLRNETYGKWEQLWGNLDDSTIQRIGQKIEEKISPS